MIDRRKCICYTEHYESKSKFL